MTDWMHYSVDGQAGPPSTVGKLYVEIAKMEMPHEAKARVLSSTTASDLSDNAGDLIASSRYPANGLDHVLYRRNDGLYVLADSDADGNLSIAVIDDRDDAGERANKVLTDLLNSTNPLPAQPSGSVRVRFWYWSGMYATNNIRPIEVPTWRDIQRNYAQSARESLSELMHFDHVGIDGGKIMLMHGPPGTGKTTAIRALADSWRSWCDVEYVIDPDRAFGEASYLINLLVSEYDEYKEPGSVAKLPRWRLIVIEDAEEFLVPDAKHEVGQSVARLLNLGDGLIGQGLRVLVMMTTNVPLSKLHPALTRPGRCLANIEVPPLSAIEATEWLGDDHAEATLAELFEARARSQIGAGISSTVAPGHYL